MELSELLNKGFNLTALYKNYLKKDVIKEYAHAKIKGVNNGKAITFSSDEIIDINNGFKQVEADFKAFRKQYKRVLLGKDKFPSTRTPKAKPVYTKEISTGVIQEYKSQKELADRLGLTAKEVAILVQLNKKVKGFLISATKKGLEGKL